jgi:3-hydroxybutyryl-CoA dehydrogenase
VSLQTLAIIGAGPAGRAFALRCAASGLDVVLEDVMPSNLRRAQDEYADLTKDAGSLRIAHTIEDAVHSADIVIDFVPDELESKLEIFSLLDRMAPPRTILCTPTRALSITDLASCTYRPGLCVALRGPINNLLDSPLEVIRSKFSDPTALLAVSVFLTRICIVFSLADDLEPMLVKNLTTS